MIDDILSTLKKRPTSYFIYSSLSAFADQGDGELPGKWFVEALEPLGHSPSAVRQALYRMCLEKELLTRKQGREKFYRMTSYGLAELRAGLEKIFQPPQKSWDGFWTLVQYSFPEELRLDRDRVRSLLEIFGFGSLGLGVYIHPRDNREPIFAALKEMGAHNHVHIFRAHPFGDRKNNKFAKTLWDMNAVNNEYKRFNSRYRRFDIANLTLDPKTAFALRYALVLDFLEIAWKDPDLPAELLPAKWVGDDAQSRAARLYKRFVGPARKRATFLLAKTNTHANQREYT